MNDMPIDNMEDYRKWREKSKRSLKCYVAMRKAYEERYFDKKPKPKTGTNMTNLQQMHQILGLKEDEPLPQLQNLVVEVKQSINGAADPWPTETLKKTKEAIEIRIKTWKWYSYSDVIDSCIYTMCLECIRLINLELKERSEYENLAR